jgi:NADH-quinone oxidoreductase subunit M
MLNHGVSTGALFLLVGILYERRHTFDLKEFGGLATPMPAYATFFLVITLSSIGLPLMNGFIGEFLILSGSFQAKAIWGILAASGVIWSACYMLWMYQRVFYGKVTVAVNNTLPDLNGRERLALWPMAALALIMGVIPMAWMNSIDATVARVLPQTQTVGAPSTASVPAVPAVASPAATTEAKVSGR